MQAMARQARAALVFPFELAAAPVVT